MNDLRGDAVSTPWPPAVAPHHGPAAPGAAPSPDTPVQRSDTLVSSGRTAATVLDAQRGAVGASFLRLRPWIVAPPIIAAQIVLYLAEASALRRVPLLAVMGGMLAFFIYEAWSVSRQGTPFVTGRRLGASMLVTVTGISIACAITGGGRSPLLPLLVAPLGVTFAAFGRRGWSAWVAGYLAFHLAGVMAAGIVAPWSFPRPAAEVVGVATVAVTAALLWAGVAALTDAHRRAALGLDRLRGAVVEEAARRQYELEGLGARVAHEVKNPLTAVKTVVQLAARQSTTARDQRRFDVAAAEVARIEAILGGYLSMSRPLDDLKLGRASLREVVETVTIGLEGRGVEVVGDAPDVAVVIDRHRVVQALLNLGLNAVAACADGGHVRVTAEVTADRIRWTVADTGVGMSVALLARATRAYVTTKPSGTGLGLALVEATARQHGGALRLTSEEGVGTTAVLELPRYEGGDGEDLNRR
ncbi:MAG: HAMP domain-containing sensor histidine kinase [Myxococcota bacterium]